MKKIFLNLMLGALLASMLTGCAGGSQPTIATTPVETVTVEEEKPSSIGDTTMNIGKGIMKTNLTPLFVIAVPIYGIGKAIKAFETEEK